MLQRKFKLHVKGKSAKAKTSVVSVFSSALGNKKVKVNGKECHIDARRVSSNDDQLARGGEFKPVKTSLSQLLTLEQTFEPDGAGKKNRRNVKQRVKMKMNVPISLLNFLDKKKGWNNFIKAKLRTVRFKNDLHGNDGGVVRWRKVRSCRKLVRIRIPPKLVVIGLKLKMIRSMMKKFVKGGADHDEDSDRELCKKRILMGRKCKPLCSSGTLSYDTDGLLLPEI